jgi:hypothetical protein
MIALRLLHHLLRCCAIGYIVIGSCGCMTTDLEGRDLTPEVLRLAQHNPRPLSLHIACPVDDIVGHQYLFVVFPFGRISVPAAAQILADTTYTKAALLGYSPSFVAAEGRQLAVQCDEISVSAYDFLVTRRVSIVVKLSARSRDRRGNWHAAEVSEHSAEFRRFAFGPILEHKLAETFDIAVDKLLHKLETTGG